MSPARAGLRAATAAGLSALSVAVFGFPQPFLAVLTSQLAVSQVGGGGRFLGHNLWAVGAGTFLGGGGLTLCAQQPWLLLPLSGVLAGAGGAWWWGSRSPVAAMVFLMGLVGALGSGLIYPEDAIANSLAHAGSLMLALISAAFAQTLFGGEAGKDGASEGMVAPSPVLPAATFGLLSGLAVMTGFGVAALFFPDLVVPLSISVVATCCGLGVASDATVVRQKIGGSILGGVIATVFVVVSAGAGNNIAVLVGGLMLVLGALETIAQKSDSGAAWYRQSAAVFAVGATMLPAPLAHFSGVALRVAAVWLGFAVALCLGLALLRLGRKPPDVP